MKKSELIKLIKEEISHKQLDAFQSNVKVNDPIKIITDKGILTGKVTNIKIDKYDDMSIFFNGKAPWSDSKLWELDLEFDDPDWIPTLYNIDSSGRFPKVKSATFKTIKNIS